MPFCFRLEPKLALHTCACATALCLLRALCNTHTTTIPCLPRLALPIPSFMLHTSSLVMPDWELWTWQLAHQLAAPAAFWLLSSP